MRDLDNQALRDCVAKEQAHFQLRARRGAVRTEIAHLPPERAYGRARTRIPPATDQSDSLASVRAQIKEPDDAELALSYQEASQRGRTVAI